MPIRVFDAAVMARTVSHPLRSKLFRALQKRRASPRELSDEFGVPLANISYHIHTLVDLGVVRLVRRVPRRGTIEHYYEALGDPLVTDEAWAATPAAVKQELLASMLRDIGVAVADAAELGGFDRPDTHLTRNELALDATGWREIAGLLLTLLFRLEEIKAASKDRLEESGEEGTHAGLVLMLFDRMQSV